MTTKPEEVKIDSTIAILPMVSIKKALGIQTKTLLSYEKEGILNPNIINNKSRYYSLGDLERARITKLLTKNNTMKLQGVKILLLVLDKTNVKPENYSNYIQSILNCKIMVN